MTSYLVLQCFKADGHTLVALLRELETIAGTFPDVVQNFVPEVIKLSENGSPTLKSIVIRIKEICRYWAFLVLKSSGGESLKLQEGRTGVCPSQSNFFLSNVS